MKIEFLDILNYSINIKKANLNPDVKINEPYSPAKASPLFDSKSSFMNVKVFPLKDLNQDKEDSEINQFFNLTSESDPEELD